MIMQTYKKILLVGAIAMAVAAQQVQAAYLKIGKDVAAKMHAATMEEVAKREQQQLEEEKKQEQAQQERLKKTEANQAEAERISEEKKAAQIDTEVAAQHAKKVHADAMAQAEKTNRALEDAQRKALEEDVTRTQDAATKARLEAEQAAKRVQAMAKEKQLVKDEIQQAKEAKAAREKEEAQLAGKVERIKAKGKKYLAAFEIIAGGVLIEQLPNIIEAIEKAINEAKNPTDGTPAAADAGSKENAALDHIDTLLSQILALQQQIADPTVSAAERTALESELTVAQAALQQALLDAQALVAPKPVPATPPAQPAAKPAAKPAKPAAKTKHKPAVKKTKKKTQPSKAKGKKT